MPPKKSMPNKNPHPETETKTITDVFEKIAVGVVILSGVVTMTSLMALMASQLSLKGREAIIEPVTPPPSINLSYPAEQRNAYIPQQVLIKFKSGVQDSQKVIEDVLADPVSIVPTETSGEIRIQNGTALPEIIPTLKAAGKIVHTLPSAEEIKTLYPDRAKRVSAGEVSADGIGLERWWLVEIEEPNANLFEIISRFSGSDDVEAAQLNYLNSLTLTPNDPYYSSSNSWGQGDEDLWGIKKINPAAAWDQTRGNGMTIAVIDSGVDYTHADLTANIWTNPGETAGNAIDDDSNGLIDDVRGFDYANSLDANHDGDYLDAGDTKDPDPMDDVGHGTHVAGTAAAVGNNAQGVVGVAYQSKIMALKALNSNGGTSENLAKAIIYAATKGADVINNSWGSTNPKPVDLVTEDAVNYAHAVGSVVVFAAGNSNGNVMQYSPQNQPNVITVASTDHFDGKSEFSNWGNRIDVAAPGGDNSDGTSLRKDRNIVSLRASGILLFQMKASGRLFDSPRLILARPDLIRILVRDVSTPQRP